LNIVFQSPKDISHNLIFIPFGLARASIVYKAPVRRDATDPDYLMFERILRNDLIQLSVLYNRHLISMKESYSAVNKTFSQMQVIVRPGLWTQYILNGLLVLAVKTTL